MNKQMMKRAVVIAIGGAVALGVVTPSSAAPVLSNTTAVKEAAPSAITDVRYRGHRGRVYRSNGAGVALGILGAAGAVVGATAYGRGSYRNPGYQRGYYDGGYGGGPYYGYTREPANYGYDNNYWR